MITIIVPVYKVEPYLRECIDSILAQTYRDFELILVDDGSPDNCGAICEEYAARDTRIRVIHQENGGLSAARNAGLDIAMGEYVTFVDSDDCIAPNYLKLLRQMVKDTGADISACEYDSKKYDGECCTEDCVPYVVLDGSAAAVQPYLQDGVIRINAWGKLYARFLWEGIRFPVGRIHEDQATVPIVLYKAKKVAASQRKLYFYRVVESSIMHRKFSLNRYDDIDAIDHCIAFFQEHKEEKIVNLAQEQRKTLLAVYSVCAREAGIYGQLPSKYQIPERYALKTLKENMPDDKYTYYLAKIHPNRLLPHAYLRKIKKMLHIPCR